ncbi:hypothetical protein [Laspinema olomoucense]|nr:hypothetical protein [Laspinema sp. D3c]
MMVWVFRKRWVFTDFSKLTDETRSPSTKTANHLTATDCGEVRND